MPGPRKSDRPRKPNPKRDLPLEGDEEGTGAGGQAKRPKQSLEEQVKAMIGDLAAQMAAMKGQIDHLQQGDKAPGETGAPAAGGRQLLPRELGCSNLPRGDRSNTLGVWR